MMESVPQSKEVNPINPQGSVALYWDFENLHAGVFKQKNGEDDDYAKVCSKPQEALMDVAAVLAFAETLGTVVINRAFGHWGKFQRYRVPLLEAAVDLVQLFPVGANGKNGADIRLCLDVMEDMLRYPHIQTIVIAAGDSDYLPLVHKIKASGRKLYGIGGTLSTNQYWAKSCHGFTYYEDLTKSTVTASSLDSLSSSNISSQENTTPLNHASLPSTGIEAQRSADDILKALVVQAMLRVARQEKQRLNCWMSKTKLRIMLKALAPDLDEQCYGYKDFKTFIASLSELLEVHPQNHADVRLKPSYFNCATSSASKSIPCLKGLPLKGMPNTRLIELLEYPLACIFRQPVFCEIPDLKTLGEVFVAWLKRGLTERRLAFNEPEALVHLLNGKATLNHYGFELFYLEHPELGGLNPENETHIVGWIEKAFLSLGLHQKTETGGLLWSFIIQKQIKKSGKMTQMPFNAFLMDTHCLFDDIPPDNPTVHFKQSPKEKQKNATKALTVNADSAIALL